MKEIEVRFLEIDKEALVKRLAEIGAKDLGEAMLEEVIFYDHKLTWKDKYVRLRKSGNTIKLTYKHFEKQTIDGAHEIEFEVGDIINVEKFLEAIGLVASRHQQKKRHKFQLGDVVVDIDTWPRIPTYVELEGRSEESLKGIAKKLNLDWSKAVFEDARSVIENVYKIPVGSMKWFTFDRFE